MTLADFIAIYRDLPIFQIVMMAVPVVLVFTMLWGAIRHMNEYQDHPTFIPSQECETVRVRMSGGGGGGGGSISQSGGTGGSAGTVIKIPTDVDQAAHEIAALATSVRDNVNMYSAVREKAVEVMTRLSLAGTKPQS